MISKFSLFATMLAVAFSWIAVSCTGPVFIKPAASATPAAGIAAAPTGKPVLASATVAGSSATATPASVATITPSGGSGILYVVGFLVVVLLGVLFFSFSAQHRHPG